MLGLDTYDTLKMKVKLERNKAFLEATHASTTVIVLDPKRAVTILDIRVLEYYKIQQNVLQ